MTTVELQQLLTENQLSTTLVIDESFNQLSKKHLTNPAPQTGEFAAALLGLIKSQTQVRRVMNTLISQTI